MEKRVSSNKSDNYILLILLFPLAMGFIWYYWGNLSLNADSLSALFSGFAFSGLIIGLRYQSIEIRNQKVQLEIQKQDLKLQIEEIQETRKVLQDQEAQMKKQADMIEQQLINQRISRIEENIERLMQSYMQTVDIVVNRPNNRSLGLDSEGVNLCNFIINSYIIYIKNKNQVEFFHNKMKEQIATRNLHLCSELSLGLEPVLIYYDNLLNEGTLDTSITDNILILIKSYLPLYLRSMNFFFANYQDNSKNDKPLKKLLIKYILNDFDDLIMRYLPSVDKESFIKFHLDDFEKYENLKSLIRHEIDSKS